ncbi:Ycf48-like protein [Zhongshania aliphaticivorans]|uniref:Ycf48-like protein n=1 Tax=Zhongshania aliphaticivorans TaxID=1470434 RepID=A0A5S9PQV1_9GAMM|nr:YCF48-related protein [Zhongshania aliphaticivorans]CAA0106772.1 Ycf48-like protein [Zhongshania aliphaticivorans]CAA0106932.1 Ycf48-like protein [Zhongshania aliphaticivorans]
MKSRLSIWYLALLMLVLIKPVLAADVDESLNSVVSQATPTDRLFSVDFNKDTGVAVGEAGLIMRTDDAGQTWKKEKSPTTLGLISVAHSGGREIAVGQMGVVLVREGTSAWKVSDSGSDMRLLKVDINSHGLAVAAGAFGTLLRSKDGGNSWETIVPDWAALYDSGAGDTAVIRDEPTNYVVKVLEDNRIIVGGEYGQLNVSEDGGDTWSILYRHPEVDGDTAATFFDLKLSGKTGYAVGQAGLVIRTDDAGKTWTSVAANTKGSFFAVTYTGASKVFVVGQRVAMKSINGGESWEQFEPLDLSLNWYSGLGQTAPNNGRIVAVGHSARILSLSPF